MRNARSEQYQAGPRDVDGNLRSKLTLLHTVHMYLLLSPLTTSYIQHESTWWRDVTDLDHHIAG